MRMNLTRNVVRCVLATMLCVAMGCGVADAKGGVKSDDNSDFVSLSEYIPDVMLDVRYYSTYNFVGRRINGYEEPCALLNAEYMVTGSMIAVQISTVNMIGFLIICRGSSFTNDCLTLSITCSFSKRLFIAHYKL